MQRIPEEDKPFLKKGVIQKCVNWDRPISTFLTVSIKINKEVYVPSKLEHQGEGANINAHPVGAQPTLKNRLCKREREVISSLMSREVHPWQSKRLVPNRQQRID
jgi:hypothetical protein